MHPRSSICVLVILMAALICDQTTALPSTRAKRQAAASVSAAATTSLEGPKSNDLNPIDSQEGDLSDVDRNKRKVPDAAFEAKNAVLGFVFGKIDSLLDTKTRLLDQLDKTNVEKNREYNIQSPVPIRDFQTLVSAVVSPKIRAVGNLANDLTTGVLTTFTAFSGGSSGNGNAQAGLGNIVTKILGFSGPILQGSSGSTTEVVPDSEEDNY
ncbi:uncharacterized protein LOC129948010 [Eupeodes corollae]|uniref:uncharacterized protein LOC129948010 n=1 Tax=Eupeodes corollae TaxID=290404 RepID=UPI0024907AEA|nr:uncharacterized protein LOC129948010 [Eupeodes corollae]XP_055914786.1 uncharacterized protein LOC129948010 [Eupeodes corollae]XP_055914787.1 uncharacterized protein LOC129948010 [Eupeodes corollae]